MDWREFLSNLGNALDLKLFEVAGTPVSLATLVTVTVILFVTWWASHLMQRGVARALRGRGVENEGTIAASSRLIHYVLLLVGFGIALQTVGVDLGALFAAGAVFAVAIGFAMQTIVQNFVSGVILLVERVIKPGDILEVEGRMIRVVRMGIRSTVARSQDEEDLIIPNSVIVQSTVKNFTFADDLFRIRVVVGVSYGSDMRKVRAVLERTLASMVDSRLTSRTLIRLSEFGASSVDWEANLWMRDPWQSPQLRSDLREAIWFAFADEGISIAFPQLDVHLDERVVAGLEAAGRAA